jgi:dedicator of cytokinesis protein 3
MAQLPPPSMLEQQKLAGEDGLPPQSESFNCSMAEVAVVILSLVLASPPNNIGRWLSEILDIEGVQACSRLLASIFSFSKSVIRHEAFPKTWLTLSLMAHGSIVKLLGAIGDIMEKEAFIPPVKASDTFDVGLWTECFELLCDLTGSEALALEEHTHQKRRAGWVIAGDLRDEVVALLVRLWNAVGWPIDENASIGDGPRYGGVSVVSHSLQLVLMTSIKRVSRDSLARS